MGMDGVFRVAVLASPSCESRAQLPATAQVRRNACNAQHGGQSMHSLACKL
jgi:hypothetical protein